MNHQIQNILCALLFSTALISTAQAGTVEASDAGKEWEKRRTRTVRPAKAPDARDNFGGFDGDRELAVGMLLSQLTDPVLDRVCVLLKEACGFSGFALEVPSMRLICPVDANEDGFLS